nr:RNA polymerase II subunit A C terminal domain [Hymenolepis microstoma]
MTSLEEIIRVPDQYQTVKVLKVKVKRRQSVNPTSIVCTLEAPENPNIPIKCPGYGKVSMLCQEGSTLNANDPLFKYEGCQHNVVMLDLCAECGANLRKDGGISGERIAAASASIPMVHMIPDLHVSESVAAEIALKDEENLLNQRKLALLIDLDQTVLHTTTTPNAFRYKNVHRFNLAGSEMIYHTRFRPHLTKFLRRMVKLFQMHICTFGNRAYAHQLASILDPKRKYFCQRILSRDECFNPITKSANLKALFPRGVHLVCIIDDRGDVWDWSPNLIQVQPYRFFPEVGDINGPPGRPLSMMSMPDFRAFTPPTPTSTESTSSSDEEGPSKSKISKPHGSIDKTGSANNGEPVAKALKGGDTISKSEENSEPYQKENESKNGESEVEHPKKTAENTIGLESKKKEAVGSGIEVSKKEESEVTATGDEPELSESKSADNNKTSVKPQNTTPTEEKLKTEKVRADGALEYPPRCMSPPPPLISPSQPRSIFEMSEEDLDSYDADYLLRLEEILTEIHRRYYRAYDEHMAEVARMSAQNKSVEYGSRLSGIPHVANVISSIRAEVLGPNTHITMSGLTPRNYPPSDSLAGRIALGLGARLHNRLRLPKDPALAIASPSRHRSFTTHLVACRQNTEKVIAARTFQAQCRTAARSPEIPFHIVSPRWLWASYFRWEHLPESQFPLDQDFNVQAFDPDANPIISRRYHHRNPNDRHRQHQYHQRRRNLRLLPLMEDEETRIQKELEAEEANPSKPVLTPDLLISTLQSIEEEEKEERRKHHRHHHRHHSQVLNESSSSCSLRKRTKSESATAAVADTSISKRRCLRNSDGHLDAPTGDGDNPKSEEDIEEDEKEKEALPKSPSLSPTSSSESEGDDDKIPTPGGRGPSSSSMGLPIDIPSSDDSDENNMSIISDSDEDALASTIDENEDSDEISEEDGDGEEEDNSIEDLEKEMEQYLPPPRPLEIAENPLLHMSPMAAIEMMEEVEDAVMEEEIERAASIPPEMLYEDGSSSSSTSHSRHYNLDESGQLDSSGESCSDDDSNDSGQSDKSHKDLEEEATRLEIQIQLLIRRGAEANRKKLTDLRQQLRSIKVMISHPIKFPEEKNRQGSHHQQNRDLSSQVEADNREFNTCPEGYDYADAEEARQLLRPETVKVGNRRDESDNDDDSGDDDGLTNKNPLKRMKNKKSILGAAGYLEASLFGSEISSSSDENDGEDGGDIEVTI